MIRQTVLPFKLQRRKYERSVVREFLESQPQSTIRALLLATKNRLISLEDEAGCNAWDEVIHYCSGDEKLKKLLGRLEERLYELSASETRQFILGVTADLAGISCKAITFGMAFSYPIINHIRRREYERYIRKRLRSNREEGSFGNDFGR